MSAGGMYWLVMPPSRMRLSPSSRSCELLREARGSSRAAGSAGSSREGNDEPMAPSEEASPLRLS